MIITTCAVHRGVVEVAKEKINEVVANHFDINTLSGSLNPICVADLGCSTGPNTFISVQNIIEAIKLKYISKGENTETPKFMVFFNDQLSNDFNTLFISLPLNRNTLLPGYRVLSMVACFPRHIFILFIPLMHYSGCQMSQKKLWMKGQLLGIKEGFSTQMHQRKLRRPMQLNLPRTWSPF